MKRVSIIGFGRFGQTLYRLLKDDFSLTIYTRNPLPDEAKMGNTIYTTDLDKTYESDVIFYAIPISSFEEVLQNHKQYFRPHHVLLDTLSVKIYPKKLLGKYLQETQTQALLTHPMFGPDSSKEGFETLPLILENFNATNETYAFWKTYFQKKHLSVIEMTAKDHDKLAAKSQGLTHFIGRLLEEMNIQPTIIDSIGTKKLLAVKEQTCNDSWKLFTDLQHFNPYTKQMRIDTGYAYEKVYNKLLPKQVIPNVLTIGIQGGKGSFNEEAVLDYLKRHAITNYSLVYLHTSASVLEKLHSGNIDQGQFAIHNSAGGIVHESITAMAQYTFMIIEEFAIKISHSLMIRRNATLSDITTIMTHPQVLAQCKQTLLQKYPQLLQTSGKGELIDHALVAKELNEKKLPKHIATMGSKILAKIYDLQIIEDNLQDLNQNYTSFLMVKRLE